MRRFLFGLALSSPALLAQTPVSGPPEKAWGASVGVLGAYGLGSFSRDTDGHPGFGLHLGAAYHLAGPHRVRPAFEWTGYRIGSYNLWDRFASSVLDQDYREERTVFRTYRLGVDYLIHQDPNGLSGPYLVLGAGGQLSHLYSDTRYVDASGQETVSNSTSKGSHTSLWLAAGLGYQGRSGGMAEVRLSTANYAAEAGQGGPSSTRIRQGFALTFLLGGRF